MLITSLRGKFNGSGKVEFRVSPLHGEQDVAALYTADGVLAVRIPTTRLNESRAFIEYTITRIVSTDRFNRSLPRGHILATNSMQSMEISNTSGRSNQNIFHHDKQRRAVIRGSRIPMEFFETCIQYFQEVSVRCFARSKSISTSRGGI